MMAGFYFGYRVRDNQQSNPEAAALGVSIDSSNVSKTPIATLPVEGVFWIKSGQNPVCPPTHPIKGTFQSDGGSFYTTTNKTYERIKPDICFASLEFAKDQVGFVQKF